MSIQDNVQDLMSYVVAKFQIVLQEAQQLQLFERELSVSQQDIFFRKLADEEHPLELFMLWKINGERKTLVLTDHDPNEKKYGKCTFQELEQRLANLNSEETEVIESLIENYSKAKSLIGALTKQ